MAASWVARIPESSEMQEGHAARASPQSKQSSWVVDKTLSTASNLAQLLPTATVLAFQSLSPSFTRRGECYATNRELTCVLIALSAVSCAFFSITDSLVGADNKLYYGVATLRGLYVFNRNGANEEERRRVFGDLEEYRLRPLDCVHAVFAVLVFLTLAFSDAMVQHCLFLDSGTNARELLVNLPLGAGVVSTLVFMLFPTSRKGIGYTNVTPTSR
ncbi:protein DMP7-like [Musa acuminata AAA Group]|uniref:protein DMP7-like n=1 Tax=Musa acuminata AAA Group TaxID=214697 RepID=UPI0031E09316